MKNACANCRFWLGNAKLYMAGCNNPDVTPVRTAFDDYCNRYAATESVPVQPSATPNMQSQARGMVVPSRGVSCPMCQVAGAWVQIVNNANKCMSCGHTW